MKAWHCIRRFSSNSLGQHIARMIKASGPISVGEFMKMVNYSPAGGYYRFKETQLIGSQGDFVTSPEISQIFGETIATYIVDQLLQVENLSARKINLIELGPGKGTMFDDFLRTLSRFPTIYENIKSCILVDTSIPLRKLQEQKLAKYFDKFRFTWTESIDEAINFQNDELKVIICNEFFDALPIHLYLKNGSHLDEVLVDALELSDSTHFRFVRQNELVKAESCSFVEVCPEALRIYKMIADDIRKSGGIFFMVDYGYLKSDGKFTLRAIKDHRLLSSPLDDAGLADISADVDFSKAFSAFESFKKLGPLSQRDFLINFGGDLRLQRLKESCDSRTGNDLEMGFHRLISKEMMGESYKNKLENYKEFGLFRLPDLGSGEFSAMGKAGKNVSKLDEGETQVLKYLQSQNRPYNATDIFNNLHGEVGKTAVTKALSTLAEKGLITGKAYGKQLIYCYRQDELPTPSSAELETLDSEIKETSELLVAKKEILKSLQQEFSIVNSTLTDEQLGDRIKFLEREIISISSRLDDLRKGSNRVDPSEKKQVDLSLESFSKEWKNRKKLCKEIISAITENLPQSPQAFMEELGIEQDKEK